MSSCVAYLAFCFIHMSAVIFLDSFSILEKKLKYLSVIAKHSPVGTVSSFSLLCGFSQYQKLLLL